MVTPYVIGSTIINRRAILISPLKRTELELLASNNQCHINGIGAEGYNTVLNGAYSIALNLEYIAK
jgi:hypothetical protein